MFEPPRTAGLPEPTSQRRSVGRYALVLLACALMLVAAACSKGSPSKSTNSTNTIQSPTNTGNTTGNQTTAPVSNNGVPVYNVYVKSFTYHGMPKTVPANTPIMVSFTNKESFEIQHEFVVLQLPKGKTEQDVINDAKKKGPKAEDDWIHFGDSGDPLDTNASTVVTMDLPPGNYVATCWQTGTASGGSGPPHVTIGMITQFSATANASSATTATVPTYNVSVKSFTYHGMPSTVPANTPLMVSFTNKESFEIQHEFVVLQLPKGKTEQDVINDAKKKGPKAEDDWIHFGDSGDPLDTNASTVVTMDLPPGNYVATCWQTGTASGGSGPPHVTIGMIKQFTASAGASASNATVPKSYQVFVKSFTYHGMPKTVPANTPIAVSFTNKESFEIQHEFVVLQLPKGKTEQDVINDAKKKGPKAEDDWIHFGDSGDPLDTNSGTVVTMDLPPGNYVATCWQTGTASGGSGPPHVTIGMITEFSAS